MAMLLTLIVCAVIVLHMYTCFSEAQHLNRWPGWQIILMFALTGTLFIYFVSRTALLKGAVQLALIALIVGSLAAVAYSY
ncbi:enterochelin ABC transporter [Neisseria bacilliformis]|uniref:enterochelin ABC transporter n=1 Tax=Neisseria bacilliformis TaxID=267212 RepID=UPI0028E1D4AB|nr:enterochelin ABC transporter [Neisseria bacilliformis]